MAGTSITESVVLRSFPFGEADRVLHLYTAASGRIGAMAKGVRRTKSRFAQCFDRAQRRLARTHPDETRKPELFRLIDERVELAARIFVPAGDGESAHRSAFGDDLHVAAERDRDVPAERL